MSKYDAHVFAAYAVKDLAEARDDVDTALGNVEKLDVTDDVRAAFRQAFLLVEMAEAKLKSAISRLDDSTVTGPDEADDALALWCRDEIRKLDRIIENVFKS